jgi:hypothetical protein
LDNAAPCSPPPPSVVARCLGFGFVSRRQRRLHCGAAVPWPSERTSGRTTDYTGTTLGLHSGAKSRGENVPTGSILFGAYFDTLRDKKAETDLKRIADLLPSKPWDYIWTITKCAHKMEYPNCESRGKNIRQVVGSFPQKAGGHTSYTCVKHAHTWLGRVERR